MDATTIKNILIAYDFSPCADRALAMGTAIAAKFEAETHVVNVINQRDVDAIEQAAHRAILAETPETPEDMVREYREERIEKLVVAIKPYRKSVKRLTPHVGIGEPVQEILALAEEQHVDLIVMGARGHSRMARLLTGSKAESLFRISSIPILSVRRDEDF